MVRHPHSRVLSKTNRERTHFASSLEGRVTPETTRTKRELTLQRFLISSTNFVETSAFHSGRASHTAMGSFCPPEAYTTTTAFGISLARPKATCKCMARRCRCRSSHITAFVSMSDGLSFPWILDGLLILPIYIALCIHTHPAST